MRTTLRPAVQRASSGDSAIRTSDGQGAQFVRVAPAGQRKLFAIDTRLGRLLRILGPLALALSTNVCPL
jgi:hypothetical protein